MKYIKCPYCKRRANLVTGETVYPHRLELFGLKFYECIPCDARVGCHKGTTKPLGRLANAELRDWKMKAHAALDPMWISGYAKRWVAYAWLANALGIKKDACHIGLFDVDTCKRVIALSHERLREHVVSLEGDKNENT